MNTSKPLNDLNLSHCETCPRKCGVDRLSGESGACSVKGPKILVSRAALYPFEEPCLTGEKGSGTVFFGGCPLHCVYCQNKEISGARVGKEITVERLAEIFLELQEKCASNVNLVTPTHYAYAIHEALSLAKKKGFRLPVVYNTSGYERPEVLRLLRGDVDIYLTDYKYEDAVLSRDLSKVPDYPVVVKEALEEMVRQQPTCVFNENGLMTRGVIVRLLLLPGHVKNGKAILEYLVHKYDKNIYYSLMSQYTPMGFLKEKADPVIDRYPELNRTVTKREYERFLSYAVELGITNAYVQEGATQSESFIPEFNSEGV